MTGLGASFGCLDHLRGEFEHSRLEVVRDAGVFDGGFRLGPGVDPPFDYGDLLLCRLRFFRRRHVIVMILRQADPQVDFAFAGFAWDNAWFAAVTPFGKEFERGHDQLALLFLRGVAGEAFAVDDLLHSAGIDRLLVRSRSETDAGGQEGRGHRDQKRGMDEA